MPSASEFKVAVANAKRPKGNGAARKPAKAPKPRAKKQPATYAEVLLSDGRTVRFSGQQRILRNLSFSGEAIFLRLDFRSGETRTYELPPALIPQFAGAGAITRYVGATPALTDAIHAQFLAGRWSQRDGRAAKQPLLIRALMELRSCDAPAARAFLARTLAARHEKEKALGLPLTTRQQLAAAFRDPATRTGQAILRMRGLSSTAADVDALLSGD